MARTSAFAPSPSPAAPPLPRRFFQGGAEAVARSLLGQVVERRAGRNPPRRARIVETEAYVGAHDLASHARFGRTARNAAMFGPPGHAYVFTLYGMHPMLNVVTAPEGDPQAVLLRAAEPLDGWGARLNGPGLLARAFGVTRADDGADLAAGALRILPGPAPSRIAATPRVGVDYAGSWRHAPLRFVDPASPHLSRRLGQRPGRTAVDFQAPAALPPAWTSDRLPA